MKEWLNLINYGLAGIAVLILLAAFVLKMGNNPLNETSEEPVYKPKPSVSSFEFPQSDYDAIGEPAITLKSAHIGLQLPDLRKILTYHGKNGRPDADPKTTVMNLSLAGTPGVTGIIPKSPIYILYDKKHKPPRYEFSPENAETSLWIEVSSEGNGMGVSVRMKDEKGELISTPSQNANFSLPEKPPGRADNVTWEIGKQRVDGTLLARQRARWFGQDRFFDRHGGEEYEQFIERQRIEFGEGSNVYSVYIRNGDVLAWNEDRWKNATPGEETIGKPLLVVKKVDERLLNFELWDPEGKSKVVLNLLKSAEAPPPVNSLQAFKFLGSRTRSQFVFEINKKRIMLSPYDWLLQADKGWKKLTSIQDIDAYVEGKTSGLLFVFDGVEKRDDRQILLGTLFNKTRSDFQKIEMVMETGTGLVPATVAGTSSAQAPQSHQAPPSPIKPLPGEKPIELHPHTRTDIREYQTNLR